MQAPVPESPKLPGTRGQKLGKAGGLTPASSTIVGRVQHWLLVRGTGERPLGERVEPGSLRAHSSTRRPGVQAGDLTVCYASVWQAIFAIAEVTGNPDHDPSRERWGWRFPIQPLLVLPSLREAPPVEAIGVFPSSVGRHSYIRLTPEQFEAAGQLLGSRHTVRTCER
jgi:hypothetical protein